METQIQQIAHHLNRPLHDLAFVCHENRVYYSHSPQSRAAPSSAIVVLLQNIFEQFVDHSFFILRKRIYTTAIATEMCLGMVKVVAKRVTDQVLPVDHHLQLPFEFIEVGDHAVSPSFEWRPSLLAADKSWLEIAQDLAKLNPRGDVLHDYDRDIAAVLVDEGNQLLAFALNANSKNKTKHAEVNLIQQYFKKTGQKIPRGAKLFSTHKPCKMCAGMIHQWSEEREKVFVFYQVEEQGSLSRHTILDRLRLNQRIT